MSKEDDDEETESAIGVGRYPCMPSLVALQQMRNRLHLAYLGKKLMKWTAMATGREHRRLAMKLTEAYGDFENEMIDCFIFLARCRYFYPNLNKMALEDPPKHAQVTFRSTIKLVSGVKCLHFEILDTGKIAYPYLGIDKGGQTIRKTKIAWTNLWKRMIRILQLQQNFTAVEKAHKAATNLSTSCLPRPRGTGVGGDAVARGDNRQLAAPSPRTRRARSPSRYTARTV